MIFQNGACYNPNTVKNHCDYAVNSYFQKKNQAVGSCDFSGVATQTQTPPTGKFLQDLILPAVVEILMLTDQIYVISLGDLQASLRLVCILQVPGTAFFQFSVFGSFFSSG